MALDIQTILVVLLANVIGTAVALPVLMGWRVSRAARAFQGAAVAQAVGWTAFLVAPRISDRWVSTLSMALSTIGFLVAWREEAERELRMQASTDGLTGLLNRQAFAGRAGDVIAAAQRYREPLALLMIDIDHFKRINDTRGHAAGDEALRTVARALKASARRGDLVSRHGGEEFCVLMTHAGTAEATAFDGRLRERLAREPGGAPGLSAGAATLQADDTLDRLVHRADLALYRAKAEGRGRLVHAA